MSNGPKCTEWRKRGSFSLTNSPSFSRISASASPSSSSSCCLSIWNSDHSSFSPPLSLVITLPLQSSFIVSQYFLMPAFNWQTFCKTRSLSLSLSLSDLALLTTQVTKGPLSEAKCTKLHSYNFMWQVTSEKILPKWVFLVSLLTFSFTWNWPHEDIFGGRCGWIFLWAKITQRECVLNYIGSFLSIKYAFISEMDGSHQSKEKGNKKRKWKKMKRMKMKMRLNSTKRVETFGEVKSISSREPHCQIGASHPSWPGNCVENLNILYSKINWHIWSYAFDIWHLHFCHFFCKTFHHWTRVSVRWALFDQKQQWQMLFLLN